MNDGARKFGLLAAVCGVALPLCACMGDPTLDASPISQRMAAAVAAPAERPTFANVPAAPVDLREPEAWRAAVGEEEAIRDRIIQESAEETFALKGDTEAFAARSRAEATNRAPAVPTAADRAATDAYAAAARQQASPPSSTR